eukprot:scaffold62013_cov18-Tisochrysis_lutea.AAC.2
MAFVLWQRHASQIPLSCHRCMVNFYTVKPAEALVFLPCGHLVSQGSQGPGPEGCPCLMARSFETNFTS